jgi:hypothetical protein
MASAEYKQIEEDLYEYASYLQANVLASELDYEPHPYQEIQALLKAELDEMATSKEKESRALQLGVFLQKVFGFLGRKVRLVLARTARWGSCWSSRPRASGPSLAA